MRDAELVTFATGALDRAGPLRADPEAQARMAADPAARCLALWRGKPLLQAAPGEAEDDAVALGWLSMTAEVFEAATAPTVFLGLEAGAPRFARTVPDWAVTDEAGPRSFFDDTRERHPALPNDVFFGDLRTVMASLPAPEAGTAATAKGILDWHRSHGFCAACGAASEVAEAGWKRLCPACGTQHFPRTDPVVIMLVLHGNAVLLGRAPAWPARMYSLLAGFVEPGESIEAAVRRETWEEAGIPVGPVDYLSSQPWPFPSSLMLGCRGMALSREITRDPVELEDARWMTREAVLASLLSEEAEVRPARRGSIARFLIERWLADSLD